MIKKTFLAVSLGILITTANAHAANFYTTLSAAHSEFDTENVNNLDDFKDNNFKLGIGAQVTPSIAVEIQYIESKATQDVIFIPTGEFGEGKVEISSLGLSAKINLLKNTKFTPYLRVGINKLNSTGKFNGNTFAKGNAVKALFGIGGEMKLTKQLALRGEYERLASNYDLLSFGAKFTFR